MERERFRYISQPVTELYAALTFNEFILLQIFVSELTR